MKDFGHPTRVPAAPEPESRADERQPMRVTHVRRHESLALCADERGRHRLVDIARALDVVRGDRVLVHRGVVIAVLQSSKWERMTDEDEHLEQALEVDRRRRDEPPGSS
jgi:hydrogenase maturation factor